MSASSSSGRLPRLPRLSPSMLAAAFSALAAVAVAACSSPVAAESDPGGWTPTDPEQTDAGTSTTPSEPLSPTTDGATPPASPVTCDASGCGGQVGSIKIFGFPTKEEAERVVTVLVALPASLTRAANFDVTRDAVAQAGCPDPTRTTISSLPAHCGYAAAEMAGTRLLLKLRDATMKVLPLRLAHVLTDFAARDWFLAHQDEVLAMRAGKNQEVWKQSCNACPADAQEQCLAHEGDLNTAYVQAMRDFTSSVAATLLEAKAWGGVGPAWKEKSGTACTVPARQAWIEDRLVAEKPASIVAQGLDIAKLCPGKDRVEYTLETTTGTADVRLVTVGGASGAKMIQTITPYAVTTTTTTKTFSMTDGLVRLTAYADKPFTLAFVRCP